MRFITVDFETYYAPDYSLSKKPWTTQSYILSEQFKAHGAGIKVGSAPAVWVTGGKLARVLASIDWSDTALIGHNLVFDGSILAWIYGHHPKLYIDTLGMTRAMVGQHSARHGLHYVAPLVAQHEGSPLHKMDGLAQAMGVRDLPAWNEKILADYTVKPPHFNDKTQLWEAGDCELEWRIFSRLAKYFPTKEYKALDWSIRAFTQPTLQLDGELLHEYRVWLADNRARALADAGLETRDLLMSNPKYAAALEQYGVICPTKVNAKGKVTYAFAKTDEGHKALLEHDDIRVQSLVSARLAVKSTIEQTRTDAYLTASALGAWPVHYHYAGAYNTHRFSGGKGGGGNPTNLKRGGTLRDAIYAGEGKTLLVGDLSQIEARLALWFGMQSPKSKGSEEESLLVMANGGDIYSHFGTIMYGRPINKHDDPLERQVAKSAVLGLGFGMGPARFIDYCKTSGVAVTPEMAENTVALYRNTYTGVRHTWSRFQTAFKNAVQYGEECALPGGVICRDPIFGSWGYKSYSGLMCKYPDLEYDPEGETTYKDGNHRTKMFGGKYLENAVQHLARCILVDMLTEIDAVYPVVMSTYDELVMSVDDTPGAIAEATAFVTKVMTRPHPHFPGLPLGVETGVGVRYGQAKH